MTRAQARRLSGRLVLLHSGPSRDWSGEPAKVIGYDSETESLIVGWAEEHIGWCLHLRPTDSLFGDAQGCASAWRAHKGFDLLPPGAAVARGAQ